MQKHQQGIPAPYKNHPQYAGVRTSPGEKSEDETADGADDAGDHLAEMGAAGKMPATKSKKLYPGRSRLLLALKP